MKSFSYSIVILSYNHPDLTDRAIASVLGLGFPPAQITLLHNGSVAKNTDFLKTKYPSLSHLVLGQNLGFSGGANAGLISAFTTASKTLFLTNDIEMLTLPADFPVNTEFFTPLIYKRKTGQIDSVMGGFNRKSGLLKHYKSADDYALRPEDERLYAPGTAFGLSKSIFESLGGFDESYHTYWEDVDFSLRAHNQGFLIGHAPEFSLRHKIGKTCHKDRFYTLYLFQRNRRKLMQKHGLFGFSFGLRYVSDMVRLFFRILLKPKPKVPLKFWWKALHE